MGNLSCEKRKAATKFGFNVTKWKKRNEDGKDIKLEAISEYTKSPWGWDYNHTNIKIVYYYDSSTLEITFKDKSGNEWSFKGTKQP